MESTLRRKYTLIDKNDFAAISAVQKVSTVLQITFMSDFPIPGPFQWQQVSCIKANQGPDKGNTRMKGG